MGKSTQDIKKFGGKYFYIGPFDDCFFTLHRCKNKSINLADYIGRFLQKTRYKMWLNHIGKMVFSHVKTTIGKVFRELARSIM